jgi:nicotinamidase-related amidase
MNSAHTIDRQRAMLLVIDMQTRLLPHIDGHGEVVACAEAMIEAAGLFDVPIMATVQYVHGLGPIEGELAQRLGQRGVEALEKSVFSVCRDEACRDYAGRLGRDQVIVTGIEAHVCVQQTVLDLLLTGVQPVVCADAVSSRRARDREVALARMRSAGAVISTTEAVMFELCELSGTPEFKQMHAIVKRLDEARAAAGRGPAGVV